MRRLKPLNDFIFKKLFGEEETKDNLIALLNAILDKKDIDKLVDLEIIDNKELVKELVDDKTGILDVRAKTSDGTQIDIEIQLTNQHNMDKRTLWYWGKLFNQGISKGEDYNKLSKVITINILDFEYIPLEKFHSKFHLWEDEDKDYMLTDLIEIHFIEIAKFRKLIHKDLKDNKLHRWLTFLREDISENELKELMEMDKDIKKAEERIEYLSSDPETIELYRAREASLHERANLLSTGRREGELNKAREVARNLLVIGLDIDTIKKATGLSDEEINHLD
ncbi:MAG: Rpn family recombination-promoting nuclease/putative transposase [Clostridium sp.]|uniref:Rpn family recombination-promoting nuclease/putative transposase n=1 Tax=Clostridium sp. TaxID=1506 RepID=UPI002FC64568